MTGWAIRLNATCPDEATAARFKAEVVKYAALYGVTVRELTAGPDRHLRLVEPEPGRGGAA